MHVCMYVCISTYISSTCLLLNAFLSHASATGAEKLPPIESAVGKNAAGKGARGAGKGERARARAWVCVCVGVKVCVCV